MGCGVAAAQVPGLERERVARVSNRSLPPEFLAQSFALRHAAYPRDSWRHLAAGEPSGFEYRSIASERTARRSGPPRGRSDPELLAAAPRRWARLSLRGQAPDPR